MPIEREGHSCFFLGVGGFYAIHVLVPRDWCHLAQVYGLPAFDRLAVVELRGLILDVDTFKMNIVIPGPFGEIEDSVLVTFYSSIIPNDSIWYCIIDICYF